MVIAAILLVVSCKRSPDPAPAPAPSASQAAVDPMADLQDGAVPEPPAAVIGSSERVRPGKDAPAVEKRTEEARPLPRIFDDYGFPVVAAVEHLCGKRDYPLTGGHVTWDAFASDVTPDELVSRYERRIGKAGLERKGGSGIWRLPVDAATLRTLEVLAPGAAGPHRACKAKPAAAAKSVILVSRH